jgi:7,8-dihydropterin-6-yl-methyl-4-(beta-D-ribofuranosyl)aminobenzene 5'-phosphate synthase
MKAVAGGADQQRWSLGVDPANLETLVPSHGHSAVWLALYVSTSSGDSRKAAPPGRRQDCFCSREWTGAPGKGNLGVLDRKALDINFTPTPPTVARH